MGGRATGEIGIAPEWFYKGDGSRCALPFEPLEIPGHAEDGGEEAEIAGVYLIAEDGTPFASAWRWATSFPTTNSRSATTSILPARSCAPAALGRSWWLALSLPTSVARSVWSARERRFGTRQIASGEENMCHSLANMEHHHFKFAGHRQPGSVHVHFFGADALSFGEGVVLRKVILPRSGLKVLGAHCVIQSTKKQSYWNKFACVLSHRRSQGGDDGK